MLEQIRNVRERFTTPSEPDDDGAEEALVPLQLAAAQLLLLTGVGASLDSIGRRPRALATSLAPALVGPLAAAAHLKRTRSESDATTLAGRILDGAAVGAGVLGLADALLGARRSSRMPALSPVALAASGVLGLILDRQSRHLSAERSKLERRARIVERLVPRRRAKVDHVVIHV